MKTCASRKSVGGSSPSSSATNHQHRKVSAWKEPGWMRTTVGNRARLERALRVRIPLFPQTVRIREPTSRLTATCGGLGQSPEKSNLVVFRRHSFQRRSKSHCETWPRSGRGLGRSPASSNEVVVPLSVTTTAQNLVAITAALRCGWGPGARGERPRNKKGLSSNRKTSARHVENEGAIPSSSTHDSNHGPVAKREGTALAQQRLTVRTLTPTLGVGLGAGSKGGKPT